jgi:hypothetical protein
VSRPLTESECGCLNVLFVVAVVVWFTLIAPVLAKSGGLP